jgi:hypothetical protein
MDLCDRAYLLSKGRVVGEGPPAKVIGEYNALIFRDERERLKQWGSPRFTLMRGTGEVLVEKIHLKDRDGKLTDGFYTGDVLDVEIHYRSLLPKNAPISLTVGFLQSKQFLYIGRFNSELQSSDPMTLPVGTGDTGVLTVRFDPLLLTTNDYTLWVMFHFDGVLFCDYKGVCPFFVSRKDNAIDRGSYFFHPGDVLIQ